MPTAKGKGCPGSPRYRPASDYDNATLAQKREYWRTKKREQRARLSERRGKPMQDSRGTKLLHLNTPAVGNSGLPGNLAAPSSPVQSNDKSCKAAGVSPASRSRNISGDGSFDAPENQKQKWFHTTNPDKFPPQLPASCSLSAKAAGGNVAKFRTARGITSPTPRSTQLTTSSSVPPVRVTRITNGSSAQTTPQPHGSMQGTSVPTMQQKERVALHSQTKFSPGNVILASSPRGPVVSVKIEGIAVNTTPQGALVTTQRAKGVGSSQPSTESEEERAAKRREHWRIKKREQRAKVAARIAKARERTQGVAMVGQRPAGLVGTTPLHRPSQSLTRAKATFTSVKKENDKVQIGATVNLQIKVQNPHENRTTQAAIPLRKFPSFVHISNVTRGIARCKTQRQRFIEAQKNFMNQRNTRCKSPLLASAFGAGNIPRIDPSDTPEQILAKRREYWRVKKREQRAKLSMEVKARTKEKDCLMRRVKRYQTILEEMRRARARTQSAGRTLTHASETIGGFIKEDGTVTIQIPKGPTGHQFKEELHVGSTTTPLTQPQHQPYPKRRGVAPIRINPAPLCPAKVKVSFPLSGQLVNKPPRILTVRPRTQLESTTLPNSHSQLTLTHPQTPESSVSGGSTAAPGPGGCVMKMAVSSSAASPSALSLDPGLTEEERMAKKREYWRIKKREQRAARATRLKHGVLQARANAALQRRRAQKQVAVTSAPQSRCLAELTVNARLPPGDSAPVIPHAHEIKQETESVPATDLNSQQEQAICPDIKHPTSPTPPPPPPPAPQSESDPALSADSQATTLRAVASMKKLLEESLSTVRECKSELPDIDTATAEGASEREMKPNMPQLFFEKDEAAPLAADLTLQIKSWQPDAEDSVHARSPSPHLQDVPRISETPPPVPSSSDAVQLPTCEHSSQTPSNFIVNPSMEVSDGPSSPRRTQRLCTKKVGHRNCSSPEPPKLQHLPVDQLRPQQQHAGQEAQEQCPNSRSPSAQRFRSVGTEPGGLTSLQQKREYWKLMKRQQRARLKVRQNRRQGDHGSQLSLSDVQAAALATVNICRGLNPQAKPSLKPKPSAVAGVPPVPVVRPATRQAEQSADTLQIELPVPSVSYSPRSEENSIDAEPSQITSDCLGAPENPEPVTEDEDSAPSLPPLKPPDNPLSSINLRPIEPQSQTDPDLTLGPITIPCSPLHSPTHMIESPSKLVPMSTMVPPKPIPGEPEEDFLRRKREYWRIKKKEQRARKAIQDKGPAPRRAPNNWRHILPAQDPPTQIRATQDCGQWLSSSDESEHLMSTSVDTDPASCPYSNYTAPLEDDAELLFADYDSNSGEEGSLSDAAWRSRYLMDYDPLNQLLVCMVCGELQYSHGLEGVRAHIDDAHPDTLALEAGERQRILEAWDEQVSRRERFFTSQLQQHSGAS